MRYLLLAVVLLGFSVTGFSQKMYAPNTTNSLTGAATYCQNATPGVLTYTYNTCNSGSGTATGTALTIQWFSNTVNSTSGGTLQSTTFVSSSTSATGNTTFLPSTIDVGTTYYYCVITWDGTGLCNTSGSLTSPVAAVVTNTSPDVITGTLSACAGTLTTLSNSVPGGTWSSSATTKASVNSSTGVVSAIASGTAIISYSIGSCRSTATFTVNANPAAITGTQTICQNATTTFANATAGGTWSTQDPSTASINASSPVTITGINAGTTNIVYTLSTGCFATRPITVNVAPAAISGTLRACIGTLTTLTNSVAGGTWVSTTTTKATIGSSSGVVGAVSAGTSVISYSIGSCRTTAVFTVNANPAVISGTQTVCEGALTTFSDATAGGTWSSLDNSTATVTSSSPGVITGVHAGNTTISYTLSTGCFAVRTVTVNTAPSAITGTLSACVGTLTTLSNAVAGGTWTSATTTKATVGSSTGVVGAVASGTSLISYSIGSCRSTATFTVNTTPAAITGTNVICDGAATTFNNTVAGGTWSITDPSIASIGASTPLTITGTDPGNTTISYTIGSCAVSRGVTVNTMPDVIVGTLNACVGSPTTLTNTVPGGTWTSATTTKATIGSSTGIVSPVSAGTSVISYTLGSCRSTATFTVNTTPAAITGTNVICNGAATTFTNAVAGGTWSITDPSIASIGASTPLTITGTNPGSATVSYTIGSCAVGRGLTVNTAPTAITGSLSACVGTLTTLTNSVAGGTWTSATTTRATIGAATGVVGAVSAGTSVISYTIGSCRSTATFTVNANPAAIAGTLTVCEQSITTLTDASGGGTWSSANESTATVSGGLVTGVNSGSVVISYTLPTGCFAVKTVTVNNAPDPISGSATVCRSSTTTLSDATASGVWSSSNSAVASINSSGVVTGVSAGAATISYTFGSCRATLPFTVLAPPASITGGTASICESDQTTFSEAVTGGAWSSADPSIASVNSAGLTTGISYGTTTISYATGCGAPATKSLTVNRTPTAFSGAPVVCENAVSTLGNSDAGGTWSGGSPSVATVDAAGNVSGVTAGTTTVTYTLGSCSASEVVTVNPMPSAISGSDLICSAAPATFTDATVGGNWSTTDAAVATVDASGVVTGLTTGAANISYTVSYAAGSCAVGYPTTVQATPSSFSGSFAVCEGAVTTLTNSIAGGEWSGGSLSVATVDASGAVYGITSGTTDVTYTVNGCAASQSVTVNTTPAAISGNALVCTESPLTFTDGSVGGAWSSSNDAVATVDASGIVSGVSAGAVDITYTLNYAVGSCSVTYPTTVSSLPAMPAEVTGSPVTFCTGTTVTMSDATPSGTWSSSAASVATVDAAGAVVGLTGGAATISYSFTNECGTVAATKDVTVVDYPAAVIAAAPVTCYHYSSDIIFTGTAGATITYKVDGGADQTAVLSGGSVSLNTGVIVSSHTYQLVEVHNATCATTIDTTATVTTQPMQWVGGLSGHETDWSYGGNWSCGFVPGDTTDVTIPAGTLYSPSIPDFAFAGAKNLTIASGAQISIAGTQLSVKGTLSNNGSITGTGPVVMAGSSAQTITGFGRVNNINFNNAAGVTIPTGSRLTVIKNLSMSAGTLTTSDSLVMYSDAAYTAAIGSISFGAAISGNVKIMQYVPGGYRRYRFWSHPFSSSISLSQIQQYIDITGQSGATNGFTTTSTNNPSCFRYNPLVGNSSLGSDPGWRAITKINASAADSNLFHTFQGLRLFIRGIKGQGLGFITETPSPVTISMVGAVNQGDQFITLSRGATTLQDYNMIGNPYPSPVDLGTVMYNAKQAGVVNGSAFYVWDPYLGAGGQYISVPIGSGGPTPYYIQANTAFQVRVAHNGDILTFTEGNKFGRYDTLLLRQAPEFVSLEIFDANEHKWDELRVKFDDKATDVDDNTADAHKLCGPDFNLYSLSADGQRLSIDARPYSDDMIIPVGIASDYKQDFTIRAADVVTPGGKPVYLHDRLKDKYTLLEPGAAYSFTIGADKSTQGDARFELTAKPGTTKTTGVSIALAPNPATDAVTITYSSAKEEQLSVRLLDINGVTVYSSDLGTVSSATTSIPVKSLAAGVYMVEVTHGAEKMVKRLVKE